MTRRSTRRSRPSPTSEKGSFRVRLSLIGCTEGWIPPTVLALALSAAACGSSPSAPSAATSQISQGLRAESSGRTQQAAADFRAAAAADHTNAVPYYQLGVLYQQRLHDQAQAATAYKRALSIDPTYWAAMFNLAIVDTPSQPQDAINLYHEIILRNPKDAAATFNLGLLLIAENQPVPGHTLLKKAIALNPALAKRVPQGITP